MKKKSGSDCPEPGERKEQAAHIMDPSWPFRSRWTTVRASRRSAWSLRESLDALPSKSILWSISFRKTSTGAVISASQCRQNSWSVSAPTLCGSTRRDRNSSSFPLWKNSFRRVSRSVPIRSRIAREDSPSAVCPMNPSSTKTCEKKNKSALRIRDMVSVSRAERIISHR